MSSNQALQSSTTPQHTDRTFTRMSKNKLNLFHVDQLLANQHPNTRQLMIQRLKLQTQQLKQLKKAISSTSVSRLNQMKRIDNHNAQDEQSEYRLQRVGSGGYAFAKSIKDLVRMGKVNKDMQVNAIVNDNNAQTVELIANSNVKSTNLENSQSNDCITKQKSRYIQRVHPEQQPLHQQQSPQLITTAAINNKSQSRFFTTTRHIRRVSAETNHHLSNKKPSILSRANSENRLRSSSSNTSNFRKHTNNSNSQEMTLAIRKQLYQMQAKQRLVQNKIKLEQKQTRHKLQRKIKQNMQLQQKHNGLYEIIQRRMQRQREKANLTRRRIEERRFIHQGKALKVSIQRLSKKSQRQQQQEMIRNVVQESALNLAYSRYLKEKRELEEQEKLAYRLSFVKDFYNKDLVGERIGCQRPKSVSTQYL